MSDLFRPPAPNWQRLSPKYLKVRVLTTFLGYGVWVPASTFGLWYLLSDTRFGFVVWAWLGLFATLFLWNLVRAPRWVRSWGYAEHNNNIYITHGLLFRTLTCVPYGRMQLVEVDSGPIDRLFDLADVKMVTASSSGSVEIPGLDRAAAEAIRDQFIARGNELQESI